VATGLTLPNLIASARLAIEVGLAYFIALAASLVVVRQTGPAAAFLIAILRRVGYILSSRVAECVNNFETPR